MDPLLLFAICLVVASAVAISLLDTRSQGVEKRGSGWKIPTLRPTDSDLGNMPDVDTAGALHLFLVSLHKRFGSVAGFWWGKQQVVSVASPSAFRELNHVFERPPELFKMLKPLLTGKSVQYANYEDGRNRRQLYDRAFSHQAIAQYYSSFQDVTDEVAAKWSDMGEDNRIPLRQDILHLAIKAITIIAFGKYFKDDRNVDRLQESHNMCRRIMEESLTHGFPAAGTQAYRDFEAAKSTTYRILQEILDKRRSEGGRGEHVPFADCLLSLADVEKRFADSITFIVGGFYTAGNMLVWALYFLARDQAVQERLAEELRAVLGHENINEDNIKRLTYLRQVQDETLRCSVLGTWGAKFKDEDMVLDGYLVPKRTPIITALGVMLQDESYWPEPDKFDPERFNSDNVRRREAQVFSPFGVGGKRMCPGRRYALAESAVVLGTLVRQFRIQLTDPLCVVKPVYGLIKDFSEEMWISVTKRC